MEVNLFLTEITHQHAVDERGEKKRKNANEFEENYLKQQKLNEEVKYIFLNLVKLNGLFSSSHQAYFQAYMHTDDIKQLFPNFMDLPQQDLFVRTIYVYKVLIGNDPQIKGSIWLHSAAAQRMDANLTTNVSRFDPNEVQEPVKQIICQVQSNHLPQAIQVSPFPVLISKVTEICRETLTGVFFQISQKFFIQYETVPLEVTISSCVGAFKSINEIQKIGLETIISLEFPRTIDTTSKKIENLKLIGAFHQCSATGRTFVFEITNFTNPVNPFVVGKFFFIKEWVRQELYKILHDCKLMMGSSITIFIHSPLENYTNPSMKAELKLFSVKKEGENEQKTSLYHFENENYMIDFLELKKEVSSIEIVEKIIPIPSSTPVVIKIMDWKNEKKFTDQGLKIIQLTEEEWFRETWEVIRYYSKQNIFVTTSKGNFTVQCSIPQLNDQAQSDNLYQLQDPSAIKLELDLRVNNLLITKQVLEPQNLLQCYIETHLEKNIFGGSFHQETLEAIIHFIKNVFNDLNANSEIVSHPSLLLISGLPENGQESLANFISDIFTPVCTIERDEETLQQNLSSEYAATLKNNEVNINSQNRCVEIILKLETSFNAQTLKSFISDISTKKYAKGYITIACTHHLEKIPKELLTIFGDNHIKLNTFTSEQRLSVLQRLENKYREKYSFNFDIDLNKLNEMTTNLTKNQIQQLYELTRDTALINGKKSLTLQDFEKSILNVTAIESKSVMHSIYT